MANSTHSIAFRRLFDAVVTNITQPLYERLCETWQAGEDKPDAYKQITQDVTHVAATLQAKKNGLSWAQFAFLGDLYDHASWAGTLHRYFNRGGTVDEHTARFCAMAQNPYYWEPPTQSLNLLRGYDAVTKTSIARMYHDLLLKIVNVTLTHVEKATPLDTQIIEEFDAFWTEVVTAARPPQNCLRQDSIELIADLNKAIGEFVVPAREVIKAVDQLSQMNGLKDTEGFIRKSFTNYCAQAILVDSVVDERELNLFHDLAPTLMFFGRQGSMENLKQIFQNAARNITATETPLLVSILDVYDKEMKTNFGAKARTLYVRLANTTFKSDMAVCEEEQVWLEQFKETLYPHGVETSPAESEQPAQAEVVSKMTVDQSLNELNSLIGLAKVKQEVAQLANVIKVQRMREEKGLPAVSAIPKHFVFCGNPATGKASVARVLGNIYREFGVLTNGHVVEVGGHSRATAIKIRDIVSSATGGVLFIDNANALVLEGVSDPQGQEAVETLTRLVEENQDNLVVILAGYPERMQAFLNAHAALKARFNKFFVFDDYSPEQMVQLFESFCSRAAFRATDSALAIVKTLFERLYSRRDEGFGNARDVRYVFECIIANQANRIINLPDVNEEVLSSITDEDVNPIVAELEKPDGQQTLQTRSVST